MALLILGVFSKNTAVFLKIQRFFSKIRRFFQKYSGFFKKYGKSLFITSAYLCKAANCVILMFDKPVRRLYFKPLEAVDRRQNEEDEEHDKRNSMG